MYIDYKYCYLIIPVINGEINDTERVIFSNIKYENILEMNIDEEVCIYRINLKNLSSEELK